MKQAGRARGGRSPPVRRSRWTSLERLRHVTDPGETCRLLCTQSDHTQHGRAQFIEGLNPPGSSTASTHKEIDMAAAKKPGQSTGNQGGIFQEVGPRGGRQPNYTTVPDNRQLPPTTKPGHAWTPVKVTPNSNR